MTSGKPVLSPGVLRTLWILQTIAQRIPRDGRGRCAAGSRRDGPVLHARSQ
jgi:hypothetical protein